MHTPFPPKLDVVFEPHQKWKVLYNTKQEKKNLLLFGAG